jgi:hypothetical protein
MGVAAVLLAGAACGSTTTTPSTSTSTLHSEVTDPSGDAAPDPSVAVSPDLTGGTVDVSAGNITFTVRFGPGTLDRSTSRLTVELDTDRNTSTGIRTDGLGVEYAIDMWPPTAQAGILKAMPGASCAALDPCYVPAGTAPLSVVGDSMAVSIPLSLLGTADGRLNFRVFAYASRAGGAGPTITADVMPNIGLPPGHVP